MGYTKIKDILLDMPDFLYKFNMLYRRVIVAKLQRLFYGSFGNSSVIMKSLRVIGAKYIHLGDRVVIDKWAYLYALKTAWNNPRIEIGNGSRIGHYVHIVALEKVKIGEKVLIADRVFISDNSHAYSDPNVPIIDQGLESRGTTEIGDGTWIGNGVVILASTVGKNCVIGSNSVVTHDIPDYSIAVGAPAVVVKSYCPEMGEWIKND